MINLRPNQVIEVCESTNDLVKKLGELGCVEYSWIQAKSQTGGRGRTGKVWISEPGNLYFSFLLRSVLQKYWTWVPLITGLAAKTAVEKLYGNSQIKIKWPNDLWCEDKKLSGVLCESVTDSQGGYIVVGIGVNCAHSPKSTDLVTTSLDEIYSQKTDPYAVRDEILNQFKNFVELMNRGSLNKIQKLYMDESLFKVGDAICWLGSDKKSLKGRVVGLGNFGELNIITLNGEPKSLVAEEISNLRF